MGNFKRGGGKRFGRNRGPVTMHQAICNQCGKSCEVPFRPTGDKPVYCSVCFGNRRENGNNRGGDRFPQVRTDDEVKKQLEILNIKMDRLIKEVEAMTNVKPLAVPVVKVKKIVKKISQK